MNKTIVHDEVAAAPAAAGTKINRCAETIKLGLDIHAKVYVVVAQHDHAGLRPPRRFAPPEFVPWVEKLLAQGHTVHVVYEACGFGFGLCRALRQAGAVCHVIAPRKLDEQRTGVKTDARDAATLCQRLSRYVDGNTKELAVIRVPGEEEEKLRHIHRQRESLVRHRTKLQAQGRAAALVAHANVAPVNQTTARLAPAPARGLKTRAGDSRHADRRLKSRTGSRRAEGSAAWYRQAHQRSPKPRSLRLEEVPEPATSGQLHQPAAAENDVGYL